MTPADMLRDAKARIANPASWCQGETARDAKGRPTSASHDDAVQLCANGAMFQTTHVHKPSAKVQSDAYTYLWTAALQINDRYRPVHVNDHLGHAAVMRMFDLAIEEASSADM